MKYRIIFLFIALTGFIQPTFALDNHSTLLLDIQTYIGYGVIVSVLLIFILTMFVLLRAFNVLTKIILKSPGYTNANTTGEEAYIKEKHSFLKPSYLLFGSIALTVICAMIYFLFDKTSAVLPDSAKSEITAKSANSKSAPPTTVTNSSSNSSGSAIFSERCSACHGAQGQGIVGPNLTDDYWIHGGKIADLSKSINNGYLDKGMPAWGKILSANQVSDLVIFIKSIKGTNPLNPKAPQGIKEL